ncbi:NADH-ubiquinone oxidoreductase chain F (EC [Olavius sp. associated proteobacterium Delta 1]|nr:NADH-ubiquinone oxidoreductase chain F (EC [Olavius sp. associated proteobacterium Delta 1]
MFEYRIALKNAGRISPENIEDYIAAGGYNALIKALQMPPEKIVYELIQSGLRGRGGAGFSTGMKKKFTSEASCILLECMRYIVCNADEGEPGTFKDRIIMEQDPHLLIEGLIIAAYAVGAEKGYIYIRGEYHTSVDMIRKALANAAGHGFLGDNILGSNYSLDIAVKLGAGSYLCGEEFTLLESIEGKRGYPRIKPPYPAEKGLFGMPTLINNVETLCHIPDIILNGADWYKNIGTEKSPGTKIFSISGDVNNPGNFEVEMGLKLRKLIYNLAGGIKDGKKFKAALIGGAAGTFVPQTYLGISMDFESLQEKAFVMGSGAIIVMAEDRSIVDMLHSILRFLGHESCGKCVPCRVGTRQLLMLLEKILAGGPNKSSEIDALLEQSELMAKTSLCPLGQSPVLPIGSALQHFRKDFEHPVKKSGGSILLE